MTYIAEIIKQLRVEHGLSQAALAKELNVSQSAIYYWETGKREPNLDTIEKIYEYFGISEKVSLKAAWEDYNLTANACESLGFETKTFTDYLLGLSFYERQKSAQLFSEEDWLLDIILGKAQQLSDEARYMIIGYTDNLIMSGKYNRETKKKDHD